MSSRKSLYDTDNLVTAVGSVLSTPDRCDRNGEPANVVDGLYAIADALNKLAKAVADKGQVRVQVDSATQARFNRMFGESALPEEPEASRG